MNDFIAQAEIINRYIALSTAHKIKEEKEHKTHKAINIHAVISDLPQNAQNVPSGDSWSIGSMEKNITKSPISY